jgi:phosphatidylglycerophosphatase A
MFFFRKIVTFISSLRNFFDEYFSLPDGFLKTPKYLLLSVFGIGFFNYNRFYFNRDILLYIMMLIIVMSFPIKVTFIILNILIIIGIYFIHDIDYVNNQIPEYVILDKAIGVLIPMIVVSNETGILLIAYIFSSVFLYHIFTKNKFWIIALTYKKVVGNLAIIIDDIVAGIMVGLIAIIGLIFI